MATVAVEVVGETGSLDGNSSIQETMKQVGVVAVSKDSMSYNFVLQVGKDSTEHNLKGTVYSHFAYYFNCSYYSKMETSLGTYLGFEASKVSSV